jgi:glycosyltransferase involved in cell wall biosynthesis
MGNPIVTVILPVYNGENYLGCAIDSVLSQTFRDFELIIVDDGSIDSTPSLVKSYGDRVRYVRKDNGGVASAFNHGIRLSSGRYISWLSHDDVFLPTKLESQVRALTNIDKPAICYSDIQFIDARGVVIRRRELPEHKSGEVLRNLLVSGPLVFASYSLLYDRRCIEEVGLYDESQRTTQDADMLIRLARRFPLVRVPEILMGVRQHGGQGSVNRRWTQDALRFYRTWLDELSLYELFPELGNRPSGLKRAKARQWLGDRYFANSMPPFYRLAIMQYLRAVGESPAILPSVMPKIVGLGRHHLQARRYFYRVGLRTAIARRYALAKREQE